MHPVGVGEVVEDHLGRRVEPVPATDLHACLIPSVAEVTASGRGYPCRMAERIPGESTETLDEETRRDGGPTRGHGAVTTTGGTAGPASVRRLAKKDRKGRKVAPTTTGDATSGGMSRPAGGTTSDATSG
ncbi:hypothetical protein [Phytohabitans kaempferiae]|uniref:Uncharacterized protein n=1 Tax=Phytohabitans kaempferiae TaxID=1620943 RepID=A0ABV6M999_9ACTN